MLLRYNHTKVNPARVWGSQNIFRLEILTVIDERSERLVGRWMEDFVLPHIAPIFAVSKRIYALVMKFKC